MYLFKFFFKGHDTSLDLVSGAGDGWVERIVEAHLLSLIFDRFFTESRCFVEILCQIDFQVLVIV